MKRKIASRRGSGLARIVEQLEPLAVPIDSVQEDPANLRKHPDRNLRAIMASLEQFGQRKPIVVRKDTGVVEAGNGTLQAARALRWERIAAVFVDDDPTTATAFAIADNRTAELAEWDEEALGAMLTSLDEDLDVELLGFTAKEIDALIGDTRPEPGDADITEPDTVFGVTVVCDNEQQQVELLDRLAKEGFKCRALL